MTPYVAKLIPQKMHRAIGYAGGKVVSTTTDGDAVVIVAEFPPGPEQWDDVKETINVWAGFVTIETVEAKLTARRSQ